MMEIAKPEAICNTSQNVKTMFLKVLPVQILCCASSSLCDIINGLVIGNVLSAAGLVALAFAAPLIMFVNAVGKTIQAGGKILCGQDMGKGDEKAISDLFNDCIFLSVLTGGFFSVVAILLSRPLSVLACGSSPGAVENTAQYLSGVAVGFIPMLVIPVLIIFLQMANEQSYSLASIFVLAICTLVLTVLAAKRSGSLLAIGLASSFGRYLTMGFLLAKFFANGKSRKNPQLMKLQFHLPSAQIVKDIARLGFPTSLLSLIYVGRNSFITQMLSLYGGETAVAALGIIYSCVGPFDAVNEAVGSAFMMVASVYIGLKDSVSVCTLTKTSNRAGLALAFIKIVILYLFSGAIASFFGAEGDVLNETVRALMLYSICMPINILTLPISAVHQNLGRGVLVTAVNFIATLIFSVVFSYFGGKVIGTDAVWSCFIGSEIITLLLYWIYSIHSNRRLPKDLADVLCLFTEEEGLEGLNLTIRSIAQSCEGSRIIYEFCLNHSVDSVRAMECALCEEEFSVNMFLMNENHQRTGVTLDIFIRIQGPELLLYLCNNGLSYDPCKALQSHEPSDSDENFGIHWVSKMAKSMVYQSTFGMNTLNILF